jgi:hypothetical protein
MRAAGSPLRTDLSDSLRPFRFGISCDTFQGTVAGYPGLQTSR